MTFIPLLLGCEGDSRAPASFTGIEVTADANVPTVQHVAFRADAAQGAWVDFAPCDEAGWRATAVQGADGRWEATIVGLPAATRACVTVGAGESVGPTTELTTAAAPAWLDLLEESSGSPTPGFLVLTVRTGTGGGATILDTHGRAVWWSEAPAELDGLTFPRARPTYDRASVWYNAMGEVGAGDDVLVRAAFDGTAVAVEPRPHAHHDFILHDDGTLALIEAETRVEDGEEVLGDRLVEYLPDGSSRQVWSVWDSFDYAESGPAQPGLSWSLANTLVYQAATDTYAVSLRNLDTIVAFDRASGEERWTMGPGGTHPPDDPHNGQHGFDILDDGVLLFDNGRAANLDSRAARYRFDDGAATLVWQYHADPPIFSFILGDAHLLDNGNTRVTFSAMGTVHEVDPDGERVASFTYEAGTILGFPQPLDTLVE